MLSERHLTRSDPRALGSLQVHQGDLGLVCQGRLGFRGLWAGPPLLQLCSHPPPPPFPPPSLGLVFPFTSHVNNFLLPHLRSCISTSCEYFPLPSASSACPWRFVSGLSFSPQFPVTTCGLQSPVLGTDCLQPCLPSTWAGTRQKPSRQYKSSHIRPPPIWSHVGWDAVSVMVKPILPHELKARVYKRLHSWCCIVGVSTSAGHQPST